jgi:rhodanese-related sulfurtransferase
MAVQSVTAATFRREVLESELPVLVELAADWSAPSKQLGPRVDDVAREFEGRLKVVRVNVDQSPELAQAFNARNVPVLVMIVNGRPAKSAPGLLSKKEILDLVEPFLPGAEDEVPAKELPALMKARRVTVIDIRDAAVFERAHIPGARSVPAVNVATSVQTLAMERKPVVVYDRASGDEAKKAMETITGMGLPAVILKGGFLAWESEGFDIERGA